MFTIYHNSKDEGHNFHSFKNKMIEICNQHKNENRALAFAFILYDFENPHLWKVLNDYKYWIALNEISGKYITVFSLNYKKKVKKKLKTGLDNKVDMQYLTRVSVNENLSQNTNELISKYFGSDFIIKYPAILFFQVNDNNVVDSLLIELKEDKIEDSFLELKEYFKSSVKALQRITPENKNNYTEIFDQLEGNIESTRYIKKVNRSIKNSGTFLGLISSIKGLF